MGIKNWFKKKEKVDISSILLEYIIKAREIGKSDKWILNEFIQKNYSDELIKDAFSNANIIKEIKGGKMKKPKEEYEEEEDESEGLEDEEDDESETEEEQEEKHKKVKKVEKSQPQVTVNDVLVNHAQRLEVIEAKLFRIQNS